MLIISPPGNVNGDISLQKEASVKADEDQTVQNSSSVSRRHSASSAEVLFSNLKFIRVLTQKLTEVDIDCAPKQRKKSKRVPVNRDESLSNSNSLKF
jgi:hypothetical protein